MAATTTTATATTTPSFTEAATLLRDAAQRQIDRTLADTQIEVNSLAYLIEHGGRHFMRDATVVGLYAEALRYEEDRPGRGATWLSTKVGRLLDASNNSSDAFFNAAGDAKREAAQRIVREMRPWLDANLIVAAIS